MLSANVANLLNTQVGLELFASSSYLQASADAYAQGLVATSEWLHSEAKQEREHADAMVRYLLERGATVRVPSVEAPSSVPDLAAMAASLLALEERVTTALQAIHDAAGDDGQSRAFALKYLSEQTEGEDAARKFGRFVAVSGDLATVDQCVRDGLLG